MIDMKAFLIALSIFILQALIFVVSLIAAGYFCAFANEYWERIPQSQQTALSALVFCTITIGISGIILMAFWTLVYALESLK